MTFEEFTNGVRVLMNIDEREFLACINEEDREYIGDKRLSDRFFKNPHRNYCELPTQDARRLFEIVQRRNIQAGYAR